LLSLLCKNNINLEIYYGISDKILLFVVFFVWFLLYAFVLYLLFWPIILCKIFHFVVLVVLSGFFFFLWLLTIFCHMSVDIVVEASWLSVFVVIIFELSNIYRCSSFSVSGFCSYCIVFSDLYPYLTEMIITLHFLSNSSTAMDRYSNMVLMILLLIFFF